MKFYADFLHLKIPSFYKNQGFLFTHTHRKLYLRYFLMIQAVFKCTYFAKEQEINA